MTGFRIYYGALEQANDFVKPAIMRAMPDARVELVRLGRYAACLPKTAISAIHEWKDPDILVTAIRRGEDGKCTEAPLFTIEFSTAAFTKDHELQRFDNYIPLMIDEFVAIKISPTGKRAGDHGGDTNYDHTMPLALVQQCMNATPYHFEWGVDKTMSRVLLDKKYLSCPPHIDGFDEIVADCMAEQGKGAGMWTDRVCAGDVDRMLWRKRLLETRLEDVTTLSSARTMYRNGTLELKINRMGHAMDPERGMLCYYGVLTSPVTAVFVFDANEKAWYDGAAAVNYIEEHVRTRGLRTPFDYARCFALGTGIEKCFQDVLDMASLGRTEINVDNFVDANYPMLPKALKTIFSFADRLELRNPAGETIVTFMYRRRRPTRGVTEYSPAPLAKGIMTEDDVTYLIVHDVLHKNNFEIVAVSYPAAQGDRVMLVEKSTGRTQKRDYIDLVYLTPASLSLHENKAKFTKNGVKKDADKLATYKTTARRSTVDDFIDRYYDGPEPKDDVKRRGIRIGVGFVYDGAFQLSQAQFLDNLDYFIHIKKTMEWTIWQCGCSTDFSIFNGVASLPPTYVVDTHALRSAPSRVT